jgi:hypothetical protein
MFVVCSKTLVNGGVSGTNARRAAVDLTFGHMKRSVRFNSDGTVTLFLEKTLPIPSTRQADREVPDGKSLSGLQADPQVTALEQIEVLLPEALEVLLGQLPLSPEAAQAWAETGWAL